MEKKVPHPNWIGLYALIAGVLGLFMLEVKASYSENTHRVVEVALVLLLFALVELWLRANDRALIMEDRERYRDYLRSGDYSSRRVQAPVHQASTNELNKPKSLAAFIPAWVLSALVLVSALLHHHKDL